MNQQTTMERPLLGSQVKGPQSAHVDADALAAKLRGRIRGEVRFDKGSRSLYATDGSNYRQVPIGVVIPRSAQDVIETVEIARSYGAPILSRGCGTSLAGQCCNVAVVMDFSKYLNRVLEIDEDAKLGVVEPGCVLDTLRNTASDHGLMYAPDPATHSHCTLGGMLGNNSCGTHSLLAAKFGLGLRTSDNTDSLDILTYDGTRMRVGETSPEAMEQAIRSGGRRGEIYAQLKSVRRKIRRCHSSHAPVATARVGLQPRLPAARKSLQHRAGSRRFRKHAGCHSRGNAPSGSQSESPLAGRVWLSRYLFSRRSRDGNPAAEAHRSGRDRPSALRLVQAVGRHCRRLEAVAGGQRLFAGRVRRRQQRGQRRPGAALHGRDSENARTLRR